MKRVRAPRLDRRLLEERRAAGRQVAKRSHHQPGEHNLLHQRFMGRATMK